jgi:hypothetical protein
MEAAAEEEEEEAEGGSKGNDQIRGATMYEYATAHQQQKIGGVIWEEYRIPGVDISAVKFTSWLQH